jgi:hypothetical protein
MIALFYVTLLAVVVAIFLFALSEKLETVIGKRFLIEVARDPKAAIAPTPLINSLRLIQ